MTTLAYRDGVLAADGRATRADLIVDDRHKKVRRLKDGSIVGVTGNPSPAALVIDWLNAGEEGPMPGTPNCCVVHLRRNGSLRVYEDSGWMDESPRKYLAWGSGWQIATVAMLYGASAKEAVHVATKLDVWSGGRVFALGLPSGAIVRKPRRPT